MGTSCTFIAQFECSICQGTLPDCTFCVLSCGHCFHAVCIHKWLERSSSCPGCRSHASKRKLRQLAGVDVVNTPCSGQHGGQVDNSREKKVLQTLCWETAQLLAVMRPHTCVCGAYSQMSELQSQLDTAEQHVHDLSETVQQLLDQQAEHKREIKRFMQW